MIQRAVTAHSYHHISILTAFSGNLYSVSRGLGLADRQQISSLGEQGRRVKQRAAGFAAAGCGVYNHEKLFLHHRKNASCK